MGRPERAALGARANFTAQDSSLWIAKFPAKEDRYDVGAWELVTRNLAQRTGIWVPQAQGLKLTDKYLTYCSERFDRSGLNRRMFTSAMTQLEFTDGQVGASYLDLAEFICDHGAQGHIKTDLEQLFRRVLFNIRIGNRDDHLRNHGFIRTPTGWRLAPAYDVNPNPYKDTHSLTFDGVSQEPDAALALAQADLYQLSTSQAKTILAEVDSAIREWRTEATRWGLGGMEMTVMQRVIAC